MKSLSEFYTQIFGCKAYKLSLDAGCTCPNRDGTKGVGGCIFCSERGSGDFVPDAALGVAEQIKKARLLVEKKVRGRSGKRTGVYIAYFQNFTSTYGDRDVLLKKYGEALGGADVKGLALATRPDCLSDGLLVGLNELCAGGVVPGTLNGRTAAGVVSGTANGRTEAGEMPGTAKGYLASGELPGTLNSALSAGDKCSASNRPPALNKTYLQIELGLQTSSEATGKAINRCYTDQDYTDAVKRIRTLCPEAHIVTHVIFGLPGETKKGMLDTVRFICAVNEGSSAWGIKITSLFIVKGTPLEKLYHDGKVTPLKKDEYYELLREALALLPDNCVLHRLTGDPPKKLLVAPDWTTDKKKILNEVRLLLSQITHI